MELLFRLAPLHDIGKVGVRDRILLKPDRLTPEEYEEMKRHTLYGSETIRLAKRMMGKTPFSRSRTISSSTTTSGGTERDIRTA